MPRSLVQVCLLLLLLASSALPAAQAAPAAQSGPTRAWASPRFGFVVEVPLRGLVVEHEPAPSDAAPHQIQESLVLLQEGREVVRLDVFLNPEKRSVQAWFDADHGFLKTAGGRLEAAVATPRRTPALRVSFPSRGQTWPREIVLFSAGDLLLRATCERADAKAAKAALDQIVATLAVGSRSSR